MQSVDLLKQCIQKITDSPSTKNISKILVASPSSTDNILQTTSEADSQDKKASVPPEEDICIRLWMPVLFGLHDVIMSGYN